MKNPACRHPARFRKPMSTARRGFTLIELMVVIAILVVLTGILAPAVRGAIELGRRAACGSNLRQMGLAHMKFASTQINSGRYLAGPTTIDSSPIPSPECVWVNRTVPTGYSYKGYRSNGVLAYRRFISPEIMYCPSWDIETWLPGKKNKTAPIIGGWVPEDPTKPGTGILSDATLTAIVST
ncbi:MAG: prepilin-type N-terminal cleavage/methylation domain-containing protein, partial [Planctomycetota bacterium]